MNGLQLSFDITHVTIYIQVKTLYSYPMGHHGRSFVIKNGQKLLKNMFLAIFTSVTSYPTHNIVSWANEWVPVMDITQGAPYTHESK
jgi:hypothetical protein